MRPVEKLSFRLPKNQNKPMPTLPPPKFKGPRRYTDNDEGARARNRAIQQIAKGYEGGGAQSDFDPRPAEEAFDAAKDYECNAAHTPG